MGTRNHLARLDVGLCAAANLVPEYIN